MAVRKQRLPEPEELFLDYVKRLRHHRDGREVVLVHMSKLEMMNRTRHHVELVTSRLGQMARKFDGRVFRFINGDIACVMRDASAGHIDNVLFEVRYGFSDDELVQAEDAGHGVFIERFDVRWDYDVVEKLAKDHYAVFQEAMAASIQTARDEQAFHAKTEVSVSGASAQPAPKVASLLDMDKDKRGDRGAKASRTRPDGALPLVAGPPVAGPLPTWLSENHITSGGALLALCDIVSPIPVHELGHIGQPPVGATIQISQANLVEAYTRTVGMKMNQRLEAFLVEEAEMSLVSLLGSLVPPVISPDETRSPASDSNSEERPFARSVCLSPQVILSPAFLLAVKNRDKDQGMAQEKGNIFWFTPEDFDTAVQPMAYIVDFLHDMGQFTGMRGLIPGEVGTLAARVPKIDGWNLSWPDMDLRRVPQGEIDGLTRALEYWGSDHTFLQGINTEDKIHAAKTFGFRYAECTDVASRKLFGL